MKKLYYLLTIIIISIISSKTVNADSNRIIGEINYVTLNESSKTLDIEGWGFIHNAQNFLNGNTHRYTIILKADDHTITSTASLKNISHTETMAFIGSRYCRNDEYFVDSKICNNYYENIGFKFSVPLNSFKMDKTYKASIKIEAFNAKSVKTQEVYYPNKNTVVLKDKHYEFTMDSKLNDMKVKVLNSSVLARSKPDKLSIIKSTKLNCGTNKNLLFEANTTFNKIFNKQLINNTTYYELSANENRCVNGRTLIAQGNDIRPVWIASTFIEHLGEALTIKTKTNNTAPTINVSEHPVVLVNTPIDIYKGVTAYDDEDGDLTDKIKVVENNYKNYPGTYTVKFSVTDSFNTTSYAIKNITIIKQNYPPVIIANDITIKQYSAYNPYDYARAIDQDNNDISNRLVSTTKVDTKIAGIQSQCYLVYDKYYLDAFKCIEVTVIAEGRDFRFIQNSRPFYKEDIPIIWQDKILRVYDEIQNNLVYDKQTLSK